MKTPNYLLSIKDNLQRSEETGTKLDSSVLNYENKNSNWDADEAIRRLRNIKPDVKRDDITHLFKDPETQIYGVYAAMIWGGISTRGLMGDHFGLLLSEPRKKVIESIGTVSALLKDAQVKSAYEYMDIGGGGKLKGVGPAFFTKIFFFISIANEFRVTAPIYDKWTQLAHNVLLHDVGEGKLAEEFFKVPAKSSQIEGLLITLKGSVAYEDYTQRMMAWASDLGVTVNELEVFIFGKDLRTKNGRESTNPRNVFKRMLKELYFPTENVA